MTRFSIGGGDDDDHHNHGEGPSNNHGEGPSNNHGEGPSNNHNHGEGPSNNHNHGEGPSNNPVTNGSQPRISKRPRYNPPVSILAPLALRRPPPSPEPYPESDEEVVEWESDGQEGEDGGADGASDVFGVDDVDGSSSPLSVTLTDPDVLDCPICFDTLTIPVFQCENGHIACSSCCTKIANKCPSCSWPIGYNRCRAIEKVLEAAQIWCPNKLYGCRLKMPYSKKFEHEKSCIYAPCSCPIDNCDFVDFSERLYAHFRMSHSSVAKRFRFNTLFPVSLEKNQKNVILREPTSSVIFLVTHSSQSMGSAVNVMCIGSAALYKKEFHYNIIYKDGDSSLKLHASAEYVLELPANLPGKKFLLIPNDLIGSDGRLKLEVCIRGHH